MESSALSKILRGKRKITPLMHSRLGKRLGLPESQINSYLSFAKVSESQDLGPPYTSMPTEIFEVISDWYHHAILELMKLQNFQNNPKWIAQKLDLSPNQARIAMERLVRVGLATDEGKLISPQNTSLNNDLKAGAYRQLQEQILELALRAVREIPIEHRDQSSMTMAVDSRRLPQARELIKRFRRQVCKLLQDSDHLDAVYQLSVSLYPLSQLTTKHPKLRKSGKRG